jgi:hypothetical protein
MSTACGMRNGKVRSPGHDPREVGAGVNGGLLITLNYGEKKLRELWTQQKIAVVRDQRQLIEWAVRGRYPIAAGLSESSRRRFKSTASGST